MQNNADASIYKLSETLDGTNRMNNRIVMLGCRWSL